MEFNYNVNPETPDQAPDGNRNDKQKKRRGKGSGWMIATMVLAAFFIGAISMKFIPQAVNSSANLAQQTAASQNLATPTAAPGLTAPPLDGSSTLNLAQGINIPAIVKADAPAVVGVLNQVKASARSANGFGTTPSQGSGGEVTQGSGSGVIFRADGYIVTNNHVVDGADALTVVLPSGEELPAKLVGADAQTDLAVLKIDKTGLPTIPFGNSDQVQVGETVIAIGNPGTADGTELSGTVTAGIISAKNRQIENDGYTFDLLQTDAAINPGNSGGALVNSAGQLIGINNMKITTSETDEYGNPVSAEGLGFAIPVNDAQPIITQLMNGSIQRPMLGVNVVEVSKDEANYEMVSPGLYIQALTQNGPAMKAGLQAGDQLESVDGAKISAVADLRNVIAKHKVGDTVVVKVYRSSDKQEHTYNVTFDSSANLSTSTSTTNQP